MEQSVKASARCRTEESLVADDNLAQKTLLRFLTCGSVDDGKSTLIGRLLYDSKLIFDDQLSTLKTASGRQRSGDEQLDLSLIVDGLEAEREQRITIDVAYRFFATPRRKFVVADAPGHEQYTRNAVTGASTADLAVVLVDARKGILDQTRRHTLMISLLGIRHIVLAVNKLDLINFDRDEFEKIAAEYREFARERKFATITPIPVSAILGDNIVIRSETMDWYRGPTLLEHLEAIDVETEQVEKPFRFPVQYVIRPTLDFRGLAGMVASGVVRKSDELQVAKSGHRAVVKSILSGGDEIDSAVAGQSVTLILAKDLDASRGDMLAPSDAMPSVANQFTATIIWFNEHPLLPGRSYILRTETDQTNATITDLKHRINIHNFSHDAAKSLQINEIGVCNLSLQSPIAFDTFDANKATGSFILIDRMTNATVGAGMIDHPLRRAENLHWQHLDVDKSSRANLKHQKPVVLWFTGLSGAGKSTVANLLEKRLHAIGLHTYLLDGDNVRHGLNRDLGFTETDRVENIRRMGEIARLMVDAGLIVIVSCISPYAADRRMARELMGGGEFFEVYVDTPLEECARRDPKGLYAKAFRGEIQNFTGVGSPYEAPTNPDIRLNTVGKFPAEVAEELARWLDERQSARK